jgi:hypothetical protein
VNCYCCERDLVRAADRPAVRWMRQGDLYCRNCDLLIRREQLVDDWPAERLPCPKHRTAATKGET